MYLKKHPRLKEFVKDADAIMQIKGFKKIANDPLTYFTEGTNTPLPIITSLISMVKASMLYRQSVSKIYVGNNLRTM